MRELLKTLKALSDTTRLRILNLLFERECCVCEVTQVLGISQSAASRGLAMLYDVGFLRRRRSGTWVLFSLNPGAPRYCQGLMAAVKERLERDEIYRADRERLRQLSPVAHSAWHTAPG